MTPDDETRLEEYYPREAIERGRQAMEDMVVLHGRLQAELMHVQLTVFECAQGPRPQHLGHNPFEGLRQDARDIRQAGAKIARFYETLANDWERIWKP